MAYERIIIVGNLGGDPTTSTTKEGRLVANFSVAVDHKRNGSWVTTWYRVAAWQRYADLAQKHLKKGSRVMVEGSGLRAIAYIDQSGKAQASLEMTADHILFLDSAQENGSDSGEYREQIPV